MHSCGMSISPDIVQKWDDAVHLYKQTEHYAAIQKFKEITPSAKMLFNIGCCYLSVDEVDKALQNFEEAVSMDRHMGIGYFMIGLIYYIKKKLDVSYNYFEEARIALRGNMYIDYSQLGLHYKLYACEIKTNQASILYRQNQIGQAKESLLLACSWKTEKRHDIISDSFNMLQAGAGYAMSLFVLPQNKIFLPSQKLVEQLKKKDYLGKAKVVAADSTEEIYACFSGLRPKKDQEIPSHVREEDVKTMLKDLKVNDKKESLKRTPPQKKLPMLKIGKVIENHKCPVHYQPKKSIPDITQNMSNSRTPEVARKPNIIQKPDVYQKQEISQKPDISQKPNISDNGLRTTPPGTTRSSPTPPKRPPLPSQPTTASAKQQKDFLISQTNTSRGPQAHLVPPPRPPPVRKSFPNIFKSTTPNKKTSLPDIGVGGEIRGNLRSPPPPFQHHFNAKVENEDIRAHDINNHNSDHKNNSNYSYVGNDDIDNSLNNNPRPGCHKMGPFNGAGNSQKLHEVEISYTFTHKVRLKEGLSLAEVKNIAEAQVVPETIHMCVVDEHGEYKSLTEETLRQLLGSPVNKKEIFCSNSPPSTRTTTSNRGTRTVSYDV